MSTCSCYSMYENFDYLTFGVYFKGNKSIKYKCNFNF